MWDKTYSTHSSPTHSSLVIKSSEEVRMLYTNLLFSLIHPLYCIWGYDELSLSGVISINMSTQQEAYKPPIVSPPEPRSQVPNTAVASQTPDTRPRSQSIDPEPQVPATSDASITYGMQPTFYQCVDCNTVFRPAMTERGTVIWKCRECGCHTTQKLPTKKWAAHLATKRNFFYGGRWLTMECILGSGNSKLGRSPIGSDHHAWKGSESRGNMGWDMS